VGHSVKFKPGRNHLRVNVLNGILETDGSSYEIDFLFLLSVSPIQFRDVTLNRPLPFPVTPLPTHNHSKTTELLREWTLPEYKRCDNAEIT
jgi:hypothetical protein